MVLVLNTCHITVALGPQAGAQDAAHALAVVAQCAHSLESEFIYHAAAGSVGNAAVARAFHLQMV